LESDFKVSHALPKKFDLIAFLIVQYILPAAAIPDLLITITRHQAPILTPLTGLALSLSLGDGDRINPSQYG
jgi:hypothetical protein